MTLWMVGLAWFAAMSMFSFAAMWLDKRAAIAGRRRWPERTLHGLEVLGGWPGSLVAQRALRHKNRKARYQITSWLIVALHMAGLVAFVLAQ